MATPLNFVFRRGALRVRCDKWAMSLSGWNLKISLWDLLESTLTYQHTTYAEAIKKVIAKLMASYAYIGDSDADVLY